MNDVKPSLVQEIETLPGSGHDEKNQQDIHHQAEVLVDKDLLSDAFRAENFAHAMGIWEAVRTPPMACFWAFIMAFTIVS